MLARLDFGVTLFFVLSGFLLSRPVVPRGGSSGGTRPRPGTTCWKRALRILPLYWVVVVVAMLVDPQNDDATWQDWVSHLTLTQLYRPDLLAQLADPDVEPVHRGRVLPRAAAALPGAHRRRRPRTLRLNRVLVGAARDLGGRRRLAGRGGPDPRVTRATTRQWLPGYLPWFMVGLAFAAVSASLGGPPARARARPARRRPRRLLDPRRRRLRPGLLAPGRAAAAAHARPGGRPAPRWCSTRSRARSSCCRWSSVPSARVGRARQLSGPVPFWLGEISYGIFCIHMIVLNLGLPGARPRRVHRSLPHGGAADPRRDLVAGDALVLLLREADPAAQERPVLRADGAAPRHRDRAGRERDRSVTHLLERVGSRRPGPADAVAPRGDRRGGRGAGRDGGSGLAARPDLVLPR